MSNGGRANIVVLWGDDIGISHLSCDRPHRRPLGAIP